MEKWKKTHGGTLRIKGLKIKKGDTVEIAEKDLKGYINQFKLVEGTVKPKAKKELVFKADPVPKAFKVSHLGRGWYNVESEGGKVMNEKTLRAEDAKKLADDLNA